MKKLSIEEMENANGLWSWKSCLGGAIGGVLLANQTGAVAAGAAFAGWGAVAVVAGAAGAGCVAGGAGL
ncbi:hypothetical protein OBK01_13580 [Empedobacter falsenii]